MDEKSQIQALDRTQPGLPLKKGRCGTMTHDYKRRLKRGVFHSLVALQEVINRFGAEANADPRPFRWTKHPDHIIAAARRGHQALDSLH